MRHWYVAKSAAKIERNMAPIREALATLGSVEEPQEGLTALRDLQERVATLQMQLLAEIQMWRHIVADEVEPTDLAEDAPLTVRLPGGALGVAR